MVTTKRAVGSLIVLAAALMAVLLAWPATSGLANAGGACNGTLTTFSPTFDDCARQVLSARHSVAVEAIYDEVRSRGRVRLTVSGDDLLDSFNGIEVRDVTTYFQVVRRNVDNPVHRQVSGSGSVTVDVPTGYVKYYIYATLSDGENLQVKFLISGESTSFLEATQQAPPPTQTPPTPSPRGIETLTLHESNEGHRLDWAIESGDGAAPTRFRIARRYHSGYQALGSDDVAQANDPERGFCSDTTGGWLFNRVSGGTRSVTFPIDPPWLQHGNTDPVNGVRWTDLRARDLYTVTPIYGNRSGDEAIVFSSSCTASLNSEEVFPRRRWTADGGRGDTGATQIPRYKLIPNMLASFHDVPATHDGTTPFTVRLTFTRNPHLSWRDFFFNERVEDPLDSQMRDFIRVGPVDLRSTGGVETEEYPRGWYPTGEITKVERLLQGSNRDWLVTIQPMERDLEIYVPYVIDSAPDGSRTVSCSKANSVCSFDGRIWLQNETLFTIPYVAP